jgi:alpha-tubulin suppressor-like RCC1 family protein
MGVRRRVGSAVLGVVLTAGAAVLVAVGPPSWATADNGSIVYGWGSNHHGEAGSGTTTDIQPRPLPVSGLPTDVIRVTGGIHFSVALAADGSVWTWGSNQWGQLGDGRLPDHTTPGRVPGLPPITQVAAGEFHVLAVGSDGSLWAWGNNAGGQLGDGTRDFRDRPVEVPIGGVTQVAAGSLFSMARRSDGTVWTWGANETGELGDQTFTDRLTPVRAATPYGITQVAAGGAFALALRFDGSVWAWGYGFDSELGNGTTNNANTPVRVDRHVSGITQIAAGANHALALGGDGTIWAWGSNFLYALGDGTTTDHSVPIHLGLTDVTQVDGGLWTSLAVRADGTLWVWGDNSFGIAGDGGAGGFVHVPTRVTALTGVVRASAGLDTMFASAAPGPATVPDLTGDVRSQAAAELSSAGLVLGGTAFVPDQLPCDHLNHVISQSVPPGTVVPPGTAVSIVIAVQPAGGCP